MNALAQESGQGRIKLHSLIQLRVLAGVITSERYQLTYRLVLCQQAPEPGGQFLVLRTGNLGHHPADRGGNINGRIMTFFSQGTAENDMAIQNRPGGISNGVVLVISFGQYSVDRSK